MLIKISYFQSRVDPKFRPYQALGNYRLSVHIQQRKRKLKKWVELLAVAGTVSLPATGAKEEDP